MAYRVTQRQDSGNPIASLGTRLLLLLLVQGEKGATRDLDDLETHTGDIADGMAATTETGDEALIVLIDEVQATIVGHEGSDLLTVLDELHTAALTNSTVRL